MKARTMWAALVLALTLASCAHQPPAVAAGAPGFFMGLVHGGLSPIALVASIFTDVRIYAFPNGGGWYDLGFLLGLSAWGGGTTAAARRR
jgi:hypothetical protein